MPIVTIKRHKTFVNFESCKDISDEFSIFSFFVYLSNLSEKKVYKYCEMLD